MMMVLRQLPRKSRIIRPVRTAAMTASRTTPMIDPRTKIDWSPRGLMTSSGGRVEAILGSRFLTPLTTLSVEAAPDLRMVTSTARWPS